MRGRARLWVEGGGQDVAGRVVAITRDGPQPRVFGLELEHAGARTRVGVEVPEGCGLPVARGDEVVVRVRSRVEGIHPLFDGCLTRADGELLVGIAGSGDPSFTPGFEVTVGPPEETVGPAGRASRSSCPVIVERGGVEARVAGNQWTTMTVGDAVYAVSGIAVRFEPGKPLPPDARDHEAWVIVRRGPEVRPPRRHEGAHQGGVPASWPALIDARWDAALRAAQRAPADLDGVDPGGELAMELWPIVDAWAEAMVILGPDAAAPHFGGARRHLDTVVRALPTLDARKGPDRVLLLLAYLALLRTEDATLSPEVDRVARDALGRLAADTSSHTDKEMSEALLAALAVGAPTLVARLTGEPLAPGPAGATFGFSISGLARFLAAGVASGAPAADLRPALISFLQGFPARLDAGTTHFRMLAHLLVGYGRFVEKTDARGLRRLFDELFTDEAVAADLPRRELLPHELAPDLRASLPARGPGSWAAIAAGLEDGQDAFARLLSRVAAAKGAGGTAASKLLLATEEIARWCAVRGPAEAQAVQKVFAGSGWPVKAVDELMAVEDAAAADVLGLLSYGLAIELAGLKGPPLGSLEVRWVEAAGRDASRGEPWTREATAFAAAYVGDRELVSALLAHHDARDRTAAVARSLVAPGASPATTLRPLMEWLSALPPQLYEGSPHWTMLVLAVAAYQRHVKKGPIGGGAELLSVLAAPRGQGSPEAGARGTAPTATPSTEGAPPPEEAPHTVALPPRPGFLSRMFGPDDRVWWASLTDLDAESDGLIVHVAADGDAWVRFVDRLDTERRHHLPPDAARAARLQELGVPTALGKVRPPFRLPRRGERAVTLAALAARGVETARKCTGDRDPTFDPLEALLRGVAAEAAAQPRTRAVAYDEGWKPPWKFA